MITNAEQTSLIKVFKLQESPGELKPLLQHSLATYNDLLFFQKGRESHILFKRGGTLKWNEIANHGLKGYLCMFKPDLLSINADSLYSPFSFIRYRHESKIDIPPDRVERFNLIFDLIHSLFKSSTESKAILIASYLMVILQEANILYSQSCEVSQFNLRSSAEMITRRFKNLIARHYLQKQTVKAYAEMLCVTPNHLNKIVKATTGKTALELITEKILIDAKALLQRSTMNVSEIAYNLGFEDTSYFTRLFRKKIGITPLKYRKM
jgi:AraC family transcriptional regulator, transcriptional activator of pobA